MAGRTALIVGAALALAALFATPASAAAETAQVSALIELRHPNGLARLVRRVSDPRRETYREYRPVGRLVRRFGARRSSRRAARRWVARRGGSSRVLVGSWVLADLPEAAARRAEGSGADARLPVPRSLRDDVRGIALLPETRVDNSAPATPEPLSRPRGAQDGLPPDHGSTRNRTGTPKGCAAGINVVTDPDLPIPSFTPNQYLRAYGLSTLHDRGLTGRGERVALIEADGFDRSDIEEFAACFGTRVPPTRLHLLNVKKPLPPGPETTLDISMLAAAAPGLDRIDVYESRIPGQTDTEVLRAVPAVLLNLVDAALGRRGRRPTVISSSLGICEPHIGAYVARAAGDLLAVAAAAGITFVDAAGDNGSADCTTAQGSTLALAAVDFPTASPYATSVGGTNIVLRRDNRLSNEIVWNNAPGTATGGGGGLSVQATRPWWQRGVVRGLGRARTVPDVAGLADTAPGYAIYFDGSWIQVGGTSAAAPLFGGGAALMSQAARRAGQPPLGFLNPLIYRFGASKQRRRVLNDVRKTGNDVGTAIPKQAGGGAPLGCCTARRGYDMASGWGSIKFQAFTGAAKRAYRASR